MAIRGSLREASLPDVLQLLALGQKTGRLSVTDRANLGRIYFDRGRIRFASIVNRRDRLGDLLVKNGLVDAATLAGAVEVQGVRQGRRLGEILVEQGAITRAHLEHYIRLQIEEAVYHLFTWAEGTFSFEAGQRPDEGEILVAINPESLLLEGARRVDEWSLIERKIPSFDLVFAFDPAATPAPDELTAEQRRVLPLVDGRRTVQDVVDESGLVEFDVGKALYGLVQAGFLRPVGRREAPRPHAASVARLQEHRSLGVALYGSAMLEEAEREFTRLLELQPGSLDARFYLGLIALRRGRDREAMRHLRQLVEDGGRWASAFQGLALALERLGRLDLALLAVEEARRLHPADSRIQLSHAVVLLKLRRAAEAVEAFARYRATLGTAGRPAAVYYAFAPLAEAALGRLERARRLGEEGVAVHPGEARVALALGAVHERAGEAELAEPLYRRALEAGPELAQAHKALGDLLYARDDHAAAAEAYRRAVVLNPELGDDVFLRLGGIAYARGDRTAAVRFWRHALRVNPRNEVARTHLELVAGAETRSGG